MTRKTFEIILIVLGIILGSLAQVHGNIIPTRVTVTSNQDTQIKIKQGGSKVSEIENGNIDILPIHYENGQFYMSDTLSMNDLYVGDGGNYYQNIFQVSLTKQIDNAYLQVDFVVEGEDAINDALRLKVKYLTNEWIIRQGESVLIDSAKLSVSDMAVTFTMWYELDDESCTIDNINAAEGSTYRIELYANVVE